jgi:hypothetical protein
MCGGRSMNGRGEKVDLLDLPVAERKRLCLEIRAALREHAAVGRIPVSDDAIVANKSLWDSPNLKPRDLMKDRMPTLSPELEERRVRMLVTLLTGQDR